MMYFLAQCSAAWQGRTGQGTSSSVLTKTNMREAGSQFAVESEKSIEHRACITITPTAYTFTCNTICYYHYYAAPRRTTTLCNHRRSRSLVPVRRTSQVAPRNVLCTFYLPTFLPSVCPSFFLSFLPFIRPSNKNYFLRGERSGEWRGATQW